MFKLTKRSFTALLALALIFSLAALFACSQTENDNDPVNDPSNDPVNDGGDQVSRTIAMVTDHLILREDGTVWQFYRQGTSNNYTIAEQIEGLDNIVYINSTRGGSFFAIRDDGTVWAWGQNEISLGGGMLGDGTTTYRPYPIQIEELSDIVAITNTRDSVSALQSDGTVWTWGWNQFGRLGDGTRQNRYSPVQIQGLPPIISIVATDGIGGGSAILCENGIVWLISLDTFAYVQIEDLPPIASMSIGGSALILISREGEVFISAGNNFFNWETEGIVAADRLERVAFTVCEQGNVWEYGVGIGEFNNVAEISKVGQIHGIENITSLIIYSTATDFINGLFLCENGYLWRYSMCFNTTPFAPTLGKVEGLEGIASIHTATRWSGNFMTIPFAFAEDGTLWAWTNSEGRRHGLYNTPQQVEFRVATSADGTGD